MVGGQRVCWAAAAAAHLIGDERRQSRAVFHDCALKEACSSARFSIQMETRDRQVWPFWVRVCWRLRELVFGAKETEESEESPSLNELGPFRSSQQLDMEAPTKFSGAALFA